jgi:DNA-binding IclR family transcriptional regulator
MSANDEHKSPIQVIDRMMRLLEVLAQHPEPLGLKQISQYTGLHPSTAHRILSSMSADRMVDRVEPGSYRLGMRLLELGTLVKSRISVRELALPMMRELHAQTGETANLSVRHGDEIVYVERTSSGRSAMRVVHVIGTRAPLHVTAAGKLFLLEDGFARLRDYAKRSGLAEHTRTPFPASPCSRRTWNGYSGRDGPATTRRPRSACAASPPASTTTAATWSRRSRSRRLPIA